LNIKHFFSLDRLPPFIRQLFGAVIGAVIALAIYGVYEIAAPSVLAWLPSHAAPPEFSDERRELRQQQIADLAKQIMRQSEIEQ
jgi:hypothetical protein